jgi:tetratricopeptide (TPR) repeat protein
MGLAMLTVNAATVQITNQSDVNKLQDQVHALDKDLNILKEGMTSKLDAQDKRITDMTATQANHIGLVANQTTTLGNWIAWASAIITILVFAAGLISFRQKDKAIEEARRASKEEAEHWFNSKEQLYEEKFRLLEQQAIETIQAAVAKVSTHSNQALQAISKRVMQADRGTAPLSAQDKQTLQALNEVLIAKPEKEFTAQEYFARGLFEFSASRFEIALDAFEKALKSLSKEEQDPTTHAKYLVAKGRTLGELNLHEEAIELYRVIDQLYSTDPTLAVREQVAKALFNIGWELARLNLREEAVEVYSSVDQRYSSDPALAIREEVCRALYNKGLCLALLNRSKETEEINQIIIERYASDTSEILRNGVARAKANLH